MCTSDWKYSAAITPAFPDHSLIRCTETCVSKNNQLTVPVVRFINRSHRVNLGFFADTSRLIVVKNIKPGFGLEDRPDPSYYGRYR